MAKLGKKYNAPGNYQQMDDFTPAPRGRYLGQLISAEETKTKAGDGSYINSRFQIIQPEDYKGKIIFEKYNIDNPNPIAVQIADKAINSLCTACDKVGVEDTDELMKIPIVIELGITPAKGDFPPSNKITKFEKWDGVETFSITAPKTTMSKASGTKKKDLPWKKKK